MQRVASIGISPFVKPNAFSSWETNVCQDHARPISAIAAKYCYVFSLMYKTNTYFFFQISIEYAFGTLLKQGLNGRPFF